MVTMLTMSATNFSAFTVFGFSGQGYSSGFQYYPQMALGTGLMALMFILVGVPARRTGKTLGLVSPPELLAARFPGRKASTASFAVMSLLTLPYLAMQPMAAGYLLEELLGVSYTAGASITVAVMVLYTFRSGLRGVALTDCFQGLLMPLLLGAVLAAMLIRGGGFRLLDSVALSHPGLFVRGPEFAPGIWLGYMLLWIWADPMFPQLFQRYYAASGDSSLTLSARLYPLVTGFLFLIPVTLGVLARTWIPELPAGEPVDRILPLLLARAFPGTLESLLAAAGLAALMSTMDSQLLTLSSMFVRDVWEPLSGRNAPRWAGKVMVPVLAGAGLLLSFHPPASFLLLARETFTGLAGLFPVYIGTIYWRRASGTGAFLGILAGAMLTGLFHFGVLHPGVTLPVVFVTGGAAAVFTAGSLVFPDRSSPLAEEPFPWRRLAAPGAVLMAGTAVSLPCLPEGRVLGLPWWVWASGGLCVAASFSMAVGQGGRREVAER
jgi:SSS family solute:Na+ symporter